VGFREAIERIPGWGRWVLGVTALRAVIAAVVPLTPEEAYHWNFAVHLDWSYFDHPPMIAWAIALGRFAFGDVPFGIRFVPLLFSAGTASLLAGAAGRWYGEKAAVWTVILLSVQPITLLASGAGFPDSPLLFFWTAALLTAWRAIESGRPLWWVASGAALGASMLSKYTAAFLGLSVFIYLVFSTRHRRALVTPWPYVACLVAAGVFAPVLFWNASHDWVSFRYQSLNRFEQADEINPIAAVKFLGQQWLGVLPLTLPLAIASLKKLFRYEKSHERFLLSAFLPMLAFFFLLGWTRSIHLMWPLPAYLSLTILMAGEVARGDCASARFFERRRRWLVGGAAVALVFAAVHTAYFLPFLSPLRGLYGWKEVAAEAQRVRMELPEGSFVLGLGRKYTCPSQIAFQLRKPHEVHGKNLLGLLGLQYDFWADPAILRGRDAVVVLEGGDRVANLMELLRKHFRSVEPAGEVVVPIGRRCLLKQPPLRFALFRARDYQPPAGPRPAAAWP